MSPVTTRRPNAEEEEILDDESEELELEDDDEKAKPAAPAVSDSRRRRQAKRGVVETEDDGEEESSAVEPTRKDRPTPSQRDEAPVKRNFIAQFIYNLREYFHEVRVELNKVAWPTRQEATRLTWIVIAVTTASAIFLGIVSYLFGLLTTSLADSTTSTVAVIIAMVLIIVVAAGWLMKDRLFGSSAE